MKTDETLALEKALMLSTIEKRTFGVSEVTIGWYGKRRVDFMTTNTKGTISCYEVKVTKSDFHSKHGHNFVGNYNYYVMTPALYKEVKAEIPKDIGVLVATPSDVEIYKGNALKSMKKATRKELSYKEVTLLRLYLLRSMAREVKKSFEADSKEMVAELKRRLEYWKNKAKSMDADLAELRKENRWLRRELRKRGIKI